MKDLPPHQGGLANSSGNTLEQTVVGTLLSKGFILVRYKDYIATPAKFGTELLIKDYPYDTIYGHKGKTEFVLKSERYNFNIRIECKWQQSTGSVDEKFPYLYLNCLLKMPESTIFIIMGGGGYKAGALEWIKTACKTNLFFELATHQKEIQILSIEEFLIWANKTLR